MARRIKINLHLFTYSIDELSTSATVGEIIKIDFVLILHSILSILISLKLLREFLCSFDTLLSKFRL